MYYELRYPINYSGKLVIDFFIVNFLLVPRTGLEPVQAMLEGF